jgi:hypothetical protein
MCNLVVLFIHFIAILARLLGPGILFLLLPVRGFAKHYGPLVTAKPINCEIPCNSSPQNCRA